ncbi:AraC-like DNA-binding protein [Kitasatospora kifunensis]|uniref:AraC-like DNA-binding protein n=1 Tax=Kitasatospora kifunensis TaxID=58351 RepID=A0A7W7RA84_KITKI|nr:AraC-like DNA-binding protein [Kitasatospora kifunensis]
MSLVLTTASVPDHDKIAYWNEAVNRIHVPVRVTPLATGSDTGPFAGRIVTDRLGYLQISTVEADPERVSRPPRLIDQSQEAFVAIALQEAGTASFTQGGRSTRVEEGELLLYDTGRPYTVDYPQRFRTRLFQLPSRALNLPEKMLGQLTGVAIRPDEGFGATLIPVLAAMAQGAGGYAPAVGDRLAGSVAELLATLAAERSTAAAADTDSAQGHLLLRIRAHIDRHLGDPALSPEGIADAHRISIRYLHRLFEAQDTTVSRLIQRRRLEECGRELARRGRASPTVSVVARRWGFVSPAHFSRAFRATYGVSPREWRDRCLSGAAGGRAPGPHGAASEPVALQQAQPELTHGGECRDGVPQALQRDFADDGDGRRVDEFADARAHQGAADHDGSLLVHDQLGVPAVAVGEE